MRFRRFWCSSRSGRISWALVRYDAPCWLSTLDVQDSRGYIRLGGGGSAGVFPPPSHTQLPHQLLSYPPPLMPPHSKNTQTFNFYDPNTQKYNKIATPIPAPPPPIPKTVHTPNPAHNGQKIIKPAPSPNGGSLKDTKKQAFKFIQCSPK